jgi:hypothetical protein
MFVKIVSDGAQEAIYQCERVFIKQMANVPNEGEHRSVFLEMEGSVNGGSKISREVIKGHEEVYVLNDLGQTIETYHWLPSGADTAFARAFIESECSEAR